MPRPGVLSTVTVFCWHLAAAFAVYGVLLLLDVALPPALGVDVPAWAGLAGVAAGLVLLRATGRGRPGGDPVTRGESGH